MRDEATAVLREFVGTSPNGLLMLDGDLRNLQASRRWIEDWGEKSVEPGVHHYESCPYVLPHWREAHEAALTSQTVSQGVDRFVVDGVERWTSWCVLPWGSTTGTRGIIIHAEDITERLLIGRSLSACRYALQSLLTQYREVVCTCEESEDRHSPICWAHSTAPLIRRAETALRELFRIEKRLKVASED